MDTSRARAALVGLSAAALLVAGTGPLALAFGSGTRTLARPAVRVLPATAGDLLWKERYNGPGNQDDGATALVVSPDGARVFVTGGGTGPVGGFSYKTVAYNASTGAPRWTRTYDALSHGFDQSSAIALSPDGSKVFVTGASTGSGSQMDYATVAYNASSGTRLWVKRYTGPGNGTDSATALGVSVDGSTVFVTGYSPEPGAGDDIVTIAYRASNGTVVWTKRFNGPGNGNDDARALAVSPNGSAIFVTGSSVGSAGDPDYITIAYSPATGASLWVKRYNGPGLGADEAHSIKVSPDASRVYVTGEVAGSDGGFDYGTVAYNASTGAQLWVQRYSGPAQRDDYATAITLSPDGSTAYVTGYSTGVANRFDYATIAYNASNGARRWVKRYNGPGNDTDDANAVAASPDGSTVVVTGASVSADHFVAYATVAYAASNGTEQWVQRYDGGGQGSDYAYALAIRPGGSAVYVTGESQAPNGYNDFATLAYKLH